MPMMFEAATADLSTITTGMQTALEGVSSQALTAISTILPTALVVGGGVIVVSIGWKLFKKFTRG